MACMGPKIHYATEEVAYRENISTLQTINDFLSLLVYKTKVRERAT